MDVTPRERWVRILTTTAEAGETALPRGVALWFQTHRGVAPLPERDAASPDDRLWTAVAAGAPIPDSLRDSDQKPNGTNTAPLFPISPDDTIEVWTERDLSGMHALSRLLEKRPDPSLSERLQSALAWHLQNTQPDNATGHPWAIHVFLERSIVVEDHEARLYAETLLHNCQMQSGRADGLSAEILRDAAEALATAPVQSD